MTSTDPRRARRKYGWMLVASVFAIVWGLITHGTFAGSGDEPHYMMIAHSIAFDGDLDVSNDYQDADLIGQGTLAPEAHAIEHRGRLTPVHDVGMPLAAAPIVGLAYEAAEALGNVIPASTLAAARLNTPLLLRHQVSLVMALLTGLLAREVFLVLRGLGGAPRTAAAWALLFAVTPPILSHSFLFFTEIPTAFITIFTLRRLTLRLPRTAWIAAILGGLIGYLLLIHARNIGIVAGLTLVAMLRLRAPTVPPASRTFFLGAVAAGVLARIAVTYLLWDRLLTTPHATLGGVAPAGTMATEIFVRATGLLFDREYGLLAYAPIYILAAAGLIHQARRRDPLSRDLLIVAVCYLIPVLLPLTNVHGWTGGWSPAARFLVPIAPLLWVGIYACAAQAGRIGKLLITAAVLLQIGIDAFLWQFPKTLWNDGDGVSAFRFSQWLPTWTDSSATPAFVVAGIAACAIGFLCSRLIIAPLDSAGSPGSLRVPPAAGR